MNTYITMWKSMISGMEHRDSTMKIWIDRGFLKLDKNLFIKGLYEYEDTAEKNYLAPRPKQILDAYNTMRIRLISKENRRIETPEEVMFNLYLEQMKLEPDKRDERLIRCCISSAQLFNDPDAYKKHFGRAREDFEKY